MGPEYFIIRTAEEFTQARADWTRLLQGQAAPSPFLTWEWMFSWWRAYGQGRADCRLAIVASRSEGRLVAILPGYIRSRTAGLNSFAILGAEYESTDYVQVVEADATATELPALLAHLIHEEPQLHIIEVANVLAGHRMLDALEAFAASRGLSFESEPRRICPYLSISGTWDAYVDQLSAKMRKNVRRAMRQAAEAGAVLRCVSDRAEVRAAMSCVFELHEKRFESKGTDTRFRAHLREPFHGSIGELLFDQEMLRLFQLTLDQRTIATVYCIEYGGVLYYLQGGFDPAWEKLSVGTAMVGHAIKYAFDRELRVFDFMRGDEAYKFRWTTTTRRMADARVGVSRTGRAVLAMRRHGLAARTLAKRLLPSRAKSPTVAPVHPT